MSTKQDDYQTIVRRDIASSFSAFSPSDTTPVSKAVGEIMYIRNNGGTSGFWSASETPYMIAPMDDLSNRMYEAVCFVGPARTGKTAALIDGWICRNVVNDPGDMVVVQMTQDKAREYSKVTVDRMIRASPRVRELINLGGPQDNTHDKMFHHGMWLRIAWPTASNLSGTTYRYVAITDRDRMPDDIDGEGDVFTLGKKRTTTFMSRGKTVVESSPGRDVTDPSWMPATPHEAPPTSGILGVYNQSDRKRFYWSCPHCTFHFEAAPGLKLFGLPEELELLEDIRNINIQKFATDYSRIFCPECGCAITPEHKHAMNTSGIWIPEGMHFDTDNNLVGEATRAPISGYWLGGVAAAYQTWESLISRYLHGLRDYALNGSELTLKSTINTDQGMPYTPRVLLHASAVRHGPESRKEDLPRHIVPAEAKFLLATVDVQAGQAPRFDVMITAVGANSELWVVDRFELRDSSTREGYGGSGTSAPIDPAKYIEDWDTLTEKVIFASYKTAFPGFEMIPRLTIIDANGEDGVTTNAYAWYRRLRQRGHHRNVLLAKGASTINAHLVRETMVGSSRGIGGKEHKGDIPLYLTNTAVLKDTLFNNLERIIPGAGYIHISEWFPPRIFEELKAEVRLPNGTYKKVRKRNETIDLFVHVYMALIRLGADRPTFWENPPNWATINEQSMLSNPYIVTTQDRRSGTLIAEARKKEVPKRRVITTSFLG